MSNITEINFGKKGLRCEVARSGKCPGLWLNEEGKKGCPHWAMIDIEVDKHLPTERTERWIGCDIPMQNRLLTGVGREAFQTKASVQEMRNQMQITILQIVEGIALHNNHDLLPVNEEKKALQSENENAS